MSTEGDGGQSEGRMDAAAAEATADGTGGNWTDERTPLLTQRTGAIDDDLVLLHRAGARGGSGWVYPTDDNQQDRRGHSSLLHGR